jgi:galactosamine-6-phosphate isomerase
MNIRYYEDYEGMSLAAAQLVYASLRAKPNLLLCAATGSSPIGLYQRLQEYYAARSEDFRDLRVVKLDEWGGLYARHPATCEDYLQRHVIKPLDITEDRYFGFDADTKDPERECERVQALLTDRGPIDVCVLGMGVNGHIGLNEPAEKLIGHCHVAELAPSTLNHTMVTDLETKPAYGLSLGVQDILAARHIILLVTGAGKEEATKQLLSGRVTNQYPVTHLQSHQRVECLVVE